MAIMFGIKQLVKFVVTGNGEHIIGALDVIIGGCILYADKSHKPGGYLPYLIFAVKLTFYYVDKDFFRPSESSSTRFLSFSLSLWP